MMSWHELGKPVPWGCIEAFRASHFKAVKKALSQQQAHRVASDANAHRDLTCTR